MLQKTVIQEVANHQKTRVLTIDRGYSRKLLLKLDLGMKNHALIISGIRRCGKSTLMYQLMKKTGSKGFFLNFDTPKLYGFDIQDFALLDEIISDAKTKILFFDEIQVVKGWELYIRQKLDEGFRVFVSGSNASLLSKELGTKLTGRHITKELFPFSFEEFCGISKKKPNKESLKQFIEKGGFPEVIKSENRDILAALVEDILYRDIAVRHNIRDIQSLKHLLTFLASNVGNLVSATKLTKILKIKSAATVMEYFGFFEDSYLLHLMPKFSYSYKAQMINPRKIYFIDNGLIDAISVSFSSDNGRRLENMVFWELRRRYSELFYYNENGKECDFVICENNKPQKLIQVSYEMTKENIRREADALFDAMNFFKMQNGIILTFNQKDIILESGKRIDVIPVHKFQF
ncbi:MAG: ATP-binding protein [Bacteroidales bacterium]|nr:ATP-binding protein [Bacteroidales bacterium]